MGAGFLIWLYLTYVHDLVLMVIGPSLAPGELFVAYVINPIGAARFLAMRRKAPGLINLVEQPAERKRRGVPGQRKGVERGGFSPQMG